MLKDQDFAKEAAKLEHIFECFLIADATAWKGQSSTQILKGLRDAGGLTAVELGALIYPEHNTYGLRQLIGQREQAASEEYIDAAAKILVPILGQRVGEGRLQKQDYQPDPNYAKRTEARWKEAFFKETGLKEEKSYERWKLHDVLRLVREGTGLANFDVVVASDDALSLQDVKRTLKGTKPITNEFMAEFTKVIKRTLEQQWKEEKLLPSSLDPNPHYLTIYLCRNIAPEKDLPKLRKATKGMDVQQMLRRVVIASSLTERAVSQQCGWHQNTIGVMLTPGSKHKCHEKNLDKIADVVRPLIHEARNTGRLRDDYSVAEAGKGKAETSRWQKKVEKGRDKESGRLR